MPAVKQPQFGPFVMAFILFLVILLLPTSYFHSFVSNHELAAAAASNNVDRYKNVFLEKRAFVQNQSYLPIIGSSTVGIFSRFHPSNYFSRSQFIPYLIGQPGVTNNLQALNFSALGRTLANKKLVFMLDTSEFEAPTGINDQGFSKYYSPLAAYSFLFTNDISLANKKLLASHLLKYSAIKSDRLLATMLRGISHADLKTRLLTALLRPIAYFKMKLLEKRDFIKAMFLVRQIHPYQKAAVPRDVSWDELQMMASQEAQQQTSSNPYGILNDVFDGSLKKDLAAQQNSWHPNSHFLNSESYDDFGAVLDVLKREHTHPLFVLIPRKGSWSDYRGFTNTYRDQLYDKIVSQVTSYGFPVLDYRSHEYDKYFMRDPWHLGWTGWVTLDQDLTQFEQISSQQNPVPAASKRNS